MGWCAVSREPAAAPLRLDDLGQKVQARMPGVSKILNEMRDSDDPDRIAEAAFLLGTLDDMSNYVDALREQDEEWMTPFDGPGIIWHESLPSPYTYERSDFCKLVAAAHEYEAALLQAREQIERQAAHVGRLRDVCHRYDAALVRISAGPRPDGTYNLSREACEQLAREALDVYPS